MSTGADWRYERLLALAGAALLWERVWSRLWPLASIVGVFFAVSLLDLLPRLPGWLHLLVLVAFAVAVIGATIRAGRGLRLPRRAECRSRLETDSGLRHRPLVAREDRLAAGADDPAARRLWDLHRSRMAAAADRLRVGLPAPGVPRRDPWGVRAGVVLLLAIGLAAAGGSAPDRLQRALSPALSDGVALPTRVELWITPPAYTGVAPIFLNRSEGSGKPSAAATDNGGPIATSVSVPQDSRVQAQVSGVRAAPLLTVGGGSIPFTLLADDSDDRRQASAYRAEVTVAAGDHIDIRLGRRVLASWPIRIVADTPPVVALANAPEAVGNGQLAIGYTAADDYGVTALAIEIRPDSAAATAAVEPIRIELPLPAARDGVASAETTQDLSAHRLAGTAVRLHLQARDALDQRGVSEDWAGVLPERVFKHPVAQAIVAERKRLSAPAPPPGVKFAVAARLDAVARRPVAFDDDIVVALALSVARARLLADSHNGVDSVRDLLWAAALHLDEGDVPRAERILSEARAKLEEAIEAGADEAEIDRLADALEQALAQYLNAIAVELARRGGLTEPPVAAEAMLGADSLRDLVEMAREMARSGARDGARALLDRLQATLDSLRRGLDAGVAGQEDLAEAGAIMQGLRELADEQQRLLDETFARLRERDAAPIDLRPESLVQQKSKNALVGTAEAVRQEDLRQRLGEMMRRLDEFAGVVPPALGAAEVAMRKAGEALTAGHLGNATTRQGDAVQALRDTMQSVQQALAQQLGAGMALFSAAGRSGDPFGRPPGDQGHGLGVGKVEIPERGALQRAGELLEELRRRAGDRERPEIERGYIERLLRRY